MLTRIGKRRNCGEDGAKKILPPQEDGDRIGEQ